MKHALKIEIIFFVAHFNSLQYWAACGLLNDVTIQIHLLVIGHGTRGCESINNGKVSGLISARLLFVVQIRLTMARIAVINRHLGFLGKSLEFSERHNGVYVCARP